VSAYHSRLPYGERVSPDPLLGGAFFPFEGDLQVVPLADPVIPEPPRNGEPGGGDCFRCANPDRDVIWRDEHWEVRAGFQPMGLPMVAGLATVRHLTLHTLTPEVVASMGSTIHAWRWPSGASTEWHVRTSAAGATAASTSTCGSSPGRSG